MFPLLIGAGIISRMWPNRRSVGSFVKYDHAGEDGGAIYHVVDVLMLMPLSQRREVATGWLAEMEADLSSGVRSIASRRK